MPISEHRTEVTTDAEPADAQRFRELLFDLQSALATGEAARVEAVREQLVAECRPNLDRLARDASRAADPAARGLALAILINPAIAEAWRCSAQVVTKFRIVKHLAQDINQQSVLKLLVRIRPQGSKPLRLESYTDLQRYVRTVANSAGIDAYHREKLQSHPQVEDLEARATGMPCHSTPRRVRRGPVYLRPRPPS